MNVQGAWAEGITGTGIVVTILDDGLEKDHPDLSTNYVSVYVTVFSFSFSFVFKNSSKRNCLRGTRTTEA